MFGIPLHCEWPTPWPKKKRGNRKPLTERGNPDSYPYIVLYIYIVSGLPDMRLVDITDNSRISAL